MLSTSSKKSCSVPTLHVSSQWAVRAGLLVAASGMLLPAVERETHQINGKAVTVSNIHEINPRMRDGDPDVQSRELWYRSAQMGKQKWQKHAQVFDANTPISWKPPEGHWEIYLRLTEINGNSRALPNPDTKGDTEFIIDRTPPAVQVMYPSNGTKLMGNSTYNVTWQVSDPYLHSTPVTISWQRTADDAPVVLADGLANSGSWSWTAPADMTNTGILTVSAADKAGNVGSGNSQQIIIDAVPPQRSVLGPTIVNNRNMNVSARVVDAGPAGLAGVELWYSTDAGSSWTKGPGLSQGPWDQIPWVSPMDGHVLLALVAADQSGNRNPEPTSAADSQGTVLVDTVVPVITLASPLGIRPIDAQIGGAARLVYRPDEEVAVDFGITELNLAPATVTVWIQKAADARWEVLGEGVATGAPFTFKIPNIGTSSARIKVTASDVAGNPGEIISSKAFRIDNVVDVDTGVTIEL